MPPTMLRTTFVPSVVTHVSVSCGDPSAISVATKHGLGLPSRSIRSSGRATAMGTILSGAELVGEIIEIICQNVEFALGRLVQGPFRTVLGGPEHEPGAQSGVARRPQIGRMRGHHHQLVRRDVE